MAPRPAPPSAGRRRRRPLGWAVLAAAVVAGVTRPAAQTETTEAPDSLRAARPGVSAVVVQRLQAWPAADFAAGRDSLAAVGLVAAARPDSARTVSAERLALVAVGIAGGAAAIYAWEKSRWWEGGLGPFQFDDHLDYAANMDKAAHFYATDVQALGATRALEWAGVRREHAALGGAVAAWLMQLQVEWHDAFYPQWGFDRYDVAANTLGAGWFYARERLPALRRFSVRWGYVPRTADPALWFDEDYQHHTYWLSARVADLLPERARRLWPEALALSAGVAVADWDPADPHDTGHAELYLSVDLNYDVLLPRRTLLGRTVADVLDRFHLPAPAVRLAPEPRFYLLFWGQ